MTAEPARRLSPRAPWVWAAQQLAGWAVALVAAAAVAGRLDAPWDVLARVLPLAGLAAGAVLVPLLRWRTWRWEVRPDAVDVRHGTLTVRRTLVPMRRVQHVDTASGVLERALGLATVRVHTAAGSHEIPLLPRREADAARDAIADLAGAAGDD